MQLEAQTFLDLVERAGALCTFDIEATGLHGDYNCVLVVAIKPYHEAPIVLSSNNPADDRELLLQTRAALSEFCCWVSFFGKGFDVPMLDTRLTVHELEDLPRRHHVDLYYSVVASRLRLSHRSQAHVLAAMYPQEKLDAKVTRKMTVSPLLWNRVLDTRKKEREAAMEIMRERCASDAAGLEALYERTRHLIREVHR